jgi:hypothetical protein
MVGVVLERGECEVHDRPKLGIRRNVRCLFFSNRPPDPRCKPQFCFCLSVLFWVGPFGGDEGTVVQYLSMSKLIRIDLRLLPRLHVSATSHFVIFPSFALPMQAVFGPPANRPPPTRFGQSGLLFFLVCVFAHLHDCLCLPVWHASLPSHFVFCPPSPPDLFFRASWSHKIKLLDQLPSLRTQR